MATDLQKLLKSSADPFDYTAGTNSFNITTPNIIVRGSNAAADAFKSLQSAFESAGKAIVGSLEEKAKVAENEAYKNSVAAIAAQKSSTNAELLRHENDHHTQRDIQAEAVFQMDRFYDQLDGDTQRNLAHHFAASRGAMWDGYQTSYYKAGREDFVNDQALIGEAMYDLPPQIQREFLESRVEEGKQWGFKFDDVSAQMLNHRIARIAGDINEDELVATGSYDSYNKMQTAFDAHLKVDPAFKRKEGYQQAKKIIDEHKAEINKINLGQLRKAKENLDIVGFNQKIQFLFENDGIGDFDAEQEMRDMEQKMAASPQRYNETAARLLKSSAGYFDFNDPNIDSKVMKIAKKDMLGSLRTMILGDPNKFDSNLIDHHQRQNTTEFKTMLTEAVDDTMGNVLTLAEAAINPKDTEAVVAQQNKMAALIKQLDVMQSFMGESMSDSTKQQINALGKFFDQGNVGDFKQKLARWKEADWGLAPLNNDYVEKLLEDFPDDLTFKLARRSFTSYKILGYGEEEAYDAAKKELDEADMGDGRITTTGGTKKLFQDVGIVNDEFNVVEDGIRLSLENALTAVNIDDTTPQKEDYGWAKLDVAEAKLDRFNEITAVGDDEKVNITSDGAKLTISSSVGSMDIPITGNQMYAIRQNTKKIFAKTQYDHRSGVGLAAEVIANQIGRGAKLMAEREIVPVARGIGRTTENIYNNPLTRPIVNTGIKATTNAATWIGNLWSNFDQFIKDYTLNKNMTWSEANDLWNERKLAQQEMAMEQMRLLGKNEHVERIKTLTAKHMEQAAQATSFDDPRADATEMIQGTLAIIKDAEIIPPADNHPTTFGGGLEIMEGFLETPTQLTADELSVGFGHKITDAEKASGMVHGIPIMDANGKPIKLTQEQAREIMYKDYQRELGTARKLWDTKLKTQGFAWADIPVAYQDALGSLAFNIGGNNAGTNYEVVLIQAIAQDPIGFAQEMRRLTEVEVVDSKTNKKTKEKVHTAGTDNRVARELFYSGIIDDTSVLKGVLDKMTVKLKRK